MIYLASPYTSPHASVMEHRYQEAMKCLAWLLARKMWAYSPIVHCHELAKQYDLPKDHHFWLEFDETMIRKSYHIFVLAIDNWATSSGVTSERKFAASLGIPTSKLTPDGFDHYTQEPLPCP